MAMSLLILAICQIVGQLRGDQRSLLMADPEHGGGNHQDNQEQNCPGIHTAVGFAGFGWIAHRIASCRFYG